MKVDKQTMAEIRHEYEQAKHPRSQIGKLAELYALDKSDVLDILGLTEVNDAPTLNEKYYPRPVEAGKGVKREWASWLPEDVERLKALKAEGKSSLEIADMLGRSAQSVRNKLYQLNRAPGEVKVTKLPVEEKEQPSQEDSSASPKNDGEKSGTCKGCNNEPANAINVSCSMCERNPGPIYCEHPTDMWEAPAASNERSDVQAEQAAPAAEAVSESVPESREALKAWLEPDGIMAVQEEDLPEEPPAEPTPAAEPEPMVVDIEEPEAEETEEKRKASVQSLVANLDSLTKDYRRIKERQNLAEGALMKVQRKMLRTMALDESKEETLAYVHGVVDMALEALKYTMPE